MTAHDKELHRLYAEEMSQGGINRDRAQGVATRVLHRLGESEAAALLEQAASPSAFEARVEGVEGEGVSRLLSAGAKAQIRELLTGGGPCASEPAPEPPAEQAGEVDEVYEWPDEPSSETLKWFRDGVEHTAYRDNHDMRFWAHSERRWYYIGEPNAIDFKGKWSRMTPTWRRVTPAAQAGEVEQTPYGLLLQDYEIAKAELAAERSQRKAADDMNNQQAATIRRDMGRIADLEAQLATLTASREEMREWMHEQVNEHEHATEAREQGRASAFRDALEMDKFSLFALAAPAPEAKPERDERPTMLKLHGFTQTCGWQDYIRSTSDVYWWHFSSWSQKWIAFTTAEIRNAYDDASAAQALALYDRERADLAAAEQERAQ